MATATGRSSPLGIAVVASASQEALLEGSKSVSARHNAL